MSADTLRRAAALMRERAAEATDSPWDGYANGVILGVGQNRVADSVPSWNTPHIASWHPAVALAVADWLDTEADEFDRYMARQIDPERRFTSIWLDSARARHKHALTVARAYLGETP